MTDPLSYVIFLAIGMTGAAFFGWLFMRWWWNRSHDESARSAVGAILAALLAIIGGSR